MRKRGKTIKTKVDAGAHLKAIFGVQPMDKAQATDLGLSYRLAFAAMRCGKATEDDFHTLACSLNVAMVLAERGYGADWLELVFKGQDALMRALARSQQGHGYALDGSGITALIDALDLHDEQMLTAKQKDVRLAFDEVRRRVTLGAVLTLTNADHCGEGFQ